MSLGVPDIRALDLNKSRERKDLIAALAIWAVSFVVLWLSPVHHVADSRYQMMFSQQLLWNHSFSVEPSALRGFITSPLPGQKLQRGKDFSFHLEQVGS